MKQQELGILQYLSTHLQEILPEELFRLHDPSTLQLGPGPIRLWRSSRVIDTTMGQHHQMILLKAFRPLNALVLLSAIELGLFSPRSKKAGFEALEDVLAKLYGTKFTGNT